MSAKTEPAATEGNCSASPTSTSLQCSGRASNNRAIMGKSTIDTSSTNKRSIGRGLALWYLASWLLGRRPSSPCKVWAVCGILLMSSLPIPCCNNWPLAILIDSTKRCFALPVGAAITMVNEVSLTACKATSSLATVYVLPVPGPPEIILTWRSKASLTA